MPKLGKSEIEKRLKRHLASLEVGTDVSKRDMQSLLTVEQMQQYEDEWAESKKFRLWVKENRYRIFDYEKRLKIADATNTRADVATKHRDKLANRDKAESRYENALERLGELQAADPSIELLFDRVLNLEITGTIGPSVHGVPRCVLSQSHVRDRRERSMIRSKKSVKIRVFECALQDLYAKPEEDLTRLPNLELYRKLKKRHRRR